MYYHIISNANTGVLGIDNIGFSADPNNNLFGPGRRNLYLIHYIISGKGYFNGSPVGKGQGFLIKPFTHEHYYPDPQDPWEYLWITSRDPAMDEIFEKYNADDKTKIFEYDYVSIVKNVAEILRRNHNRLYAPMEILEIFLYIFNHHTKIGKAKDNPAEIYYNYSLNYIQSNMYRAVRVEELLQILGISQPYLYRIFKDRCAMSPKQYIDNCKLTEAKRLLTETAMSVTEVANSVGYSDALAFSFFFKKKTGQSPKNFRK